MFRPTQYTLDMPLIVQLDDLNLAEFTTIAADHGLDEFAYVVTPNVDHIIRLSENNEFRSLYADASFVLLDSRFLSIILKLMGGPNTKVCTGSDLTAALFGRVMRPDDVVVVIGGSEQQAAQLRKTYGLRQLRHYNPPMGFIDDPAAVEACLSYIESNSPFRFCLIGVGTPQGEKVAYLLKKRGHAKGMTFCIGASMNFLTGAERRAPRWIRLLGLEWLFRLALHPRRLGYRYLVRGPRLFGLLPHIQFTFRRTGLPHGYTAALGAPRPDTIAHVASTKSD